jgi:hypothetical protein
MLIKLTFKANMVLLICNPVKHYMFKNPWPRIVPPFPRKGCLSTVFSRERPCECPSDPSELITEPLSWRGNRGFAAGLARMSSLAWRFIAINLWKH